MISNVIQYDDVLIKEDNNTENTDLRCCSQRSVLSCHKPAWASRI